MNTSAPSFDPLIQHSIDDPAAMISLSRERPDEIERALHAAAANFGRNRPLINDASLAVAAFAADDRLRAATPAFAALGIGDWQTLEGRWVGEPLSGSVGRLRLDEAGSVTLAITASAEEALATWLLPPSVREACQASRDLRVVVLAPSLASSLPLEWACDCFGLSNLQKRVTVATLTTGFAKTAAARLGLSYQTVRSTLSQVFRIIDVPNLPACVSRIVTTALGMVPHAGGNDRLIVSDMLGLSPRQAHVAVLISQGLSRTAVADALGVSEAVVRKELDSIFRLAGVGSAAELARLVGDVRAMGVLTRATGHSLGSQHPDFEPLQLLPRSDGSGQIGWSDYGPRSGRPVLLVHSSYSCRHAPRRLVRLLQRRGFRPLAIDRPGFGASDDGTHSAPFGTAIEDLAAVLARIRVGKVDVVARGGAQFVMALQRERPDLLGRVIVASPTMHTTRQSQRRGAQGVARELFFQRPALITLVLKLLAGQLTFERVTQLLRDATAASPADRALMDDGEFLRDFYRAFRPFSTGRIAGIVREQRELATGKVPAPLPQTGHWVVLTGDQDGYDNHAQIERYMRHVAPDAAFVTVPDGGRFITVTHAELVADLLSEPLRAVA